jgi:hypothetical protein
MVQNPEKAIVRRFARLNMKNLLYMQADLVELEDQLDQAVRYDKQFEDTRPYARSWLWLENSHVLPQMPDKMPSEDPAVEGIQGRIQLRDLSMDLGIHAIKRSDTRLPPDTIIPLGPSTRKICST